VVNLLDRPSSVLLADYDLTAGQIWVLVPIATAVAPCSGPDAADSAAAGPRSIVVVGGP
jgi:hypothetical protein